MTAKVPHLSKELRAKAIQHFVVIYLLASICEGLALFSVSVWMLSQQSSAYCLGFSQQYLPVYLCLAASCVLLAISIRGCVATQQKNKPKYFRYLAVTIIIVIILEIIAGISGAAFLMEIRGDQLISKLKMAQQDYLTDTSVKSCWDHLQPNRKCCGTTNFQDWKLLFADMPLANVPFPESCRCEVLEPGQNSSKFCLELPIQLTVKDMQRNMSNNTIPNSGVFQYGCQLTIHNDLEDMLVVIVAIAMVIAVTQIITTVLSIFIVSRIANSSVVEVYVAKEGTDVDNPNLARLERNENVNPSRPVTADFTTRRPSSCWSTSETEAEQQHS